MSHEDFQDKFLKIGYSKRKEGGSTSVCDRPYIGAKGIGKLALLSCAQRVSVFTKTSATNYVGGVIDNQGLDQAITEDLTPQQYPLEQLDFSLIEGLTANHEHGTTIVFQNTKDKLNNSETFIRNVIALSFKFSLIDADFAIHVNGIPVTIADLSDLCRKTEFVWLINNYNDSYTEALVNLKSDPIKVDAALPIKGYLATVEKSRDAEISQTEERASVDLFVNGRLREKIFLLGIFPRREFWRATYTARYIMMN